MPNEISTPPLVQASTKKSSNVDTLLTVAAVGGAGLLLYKYWYLPNKVQQNSAKYASIIPNFADYALPKALPPPPQPKKSSGGSSFWGIFGSVAGGLIGGVAGFFSGGPAGAAAGAATGVGVGKKIATSL